MSFIAEKLRLPITAPEVMQSASGSMGHAFSLWFQKEGMQDEYSRESQKHFFLEQNRAMWKFIQLFDSYATMELNKPGMSQKGYQLKQSIGAKIGTYKTVEEQEKKLTPKEIGELIALDIQKSIIAEQNG